jgi:drug/metabolite transporter (DMT)-like permease
MAARRYAVVRLVLCAVLWSTGGILIKWIAWPALAVAGMRSGIAAVVLLLALREWRGPWSWWHVSGALAGAASMLVYTAPLYVALLSPWVLREPLRGADWLTLLLALLGMGCFSGEQLTTEGWTGNLCALGSGLALAWLVVCLGKHAATSPLTILVLANVLVAVAGVRFMLTTMPDPVSWGGLLVAGVMQLGVSRRSYTARPSRMCEPLRPS